MSVVFEKQNAKKRRMIQGTCQYRIEDALFIYMYFLYSVAT